MLDSKKSVLT